jgi:hypothetical protein
MKRVSAQTLHFEAKPWYLVRKEQFFLTAVRMWWCFGSSWKGRSYNRKKGDEL